jgi:uncharacterized protein (UPF0332 family)
MKKDRDISELLEKARESLEVAVELYSGSHYDFSASRSYYAMFYTTQALLLTKNLSFSRHKAVISVFGKEFAKTGLLPGKLHRHLRDAFRFRQLGDYGAPGSVSKEKANTIIEQAKEFIEAIGGYLRKEGYNL